MKLHLGCGQVIKPGWINIDEQAYAPGTTIHDLRRGLPYGDRTVDVIYMEHFIEHLSRPDGVTLLRECARVLKPGATIRLSTPDLAEFVRIYAGKLSLGRWGDIWRPRSYAVMFDDEFRQWGHKFIYDEEELTAVLHEAGLPKVRRCTWGESDVTHLVGCDLRPKEWNDLILEAWV